ncbi:hypothetical protein ACKKBG_A15030 [Auxenochlorella protothecoides x Auxenochlorella symbiontica]|uniref:AP2/ERF domain-containing protein n=1 Tax=Auxenochlorella protothecoides TaxID=3075 RepID=A0A1D1ZTT1_AUXPR
MNSTVDRDRICNGSGIRYSAPESLDTHYTMLYTKQGGDVHQEPGRGVAQAGEDSGTQTSAESLRGSFFRLLPNLLNLPAELNPGPGPPTKAAPRFRGITKHKRTQRYEAHFWEQKKQVYLGSFQHEVHAAKCHDIMALRCKGLACDALNFPAETYRCMFHLIEAMTQDDIVAELRHHSKDQAAKLRAGAEAAAPARPAPGKARATPSPASPAAPHTPTAQQQPLHAVSYLSADLLPRTLVLEASAESAPAPSLGAHTHAPATSSLLGKRGLAALGGFDEAWDALEMEELWSDMDDSILTLDSLEQSFMYRGGPPSLDPLEHIDGTALFLPAELRPPGAEGAGGRTGGVPRLMRAGPGGLTVSIGSGQGLKRHDSSLSGLSQSGEHSTQSMTPSQVYRGVPLSASHDPAQTS